MMRKSIIKTLQVFPLLIVLYLAGGLVAYMMPDARVRSNAEKTIYIGDLLKDYPKAILFDDLNAQDAYTLDNFTDAIIVNQSVLMSDEGWRGMLLLPRFTAEGSTDQCYNLSQMLSGSTDGHKTYYGRYWHGSTFITRVLLTFTTFGGIRYFFFFVTTLLMAWCGIRLWRHVSKAACACMLLALLSVNVYVMQFSVQFVMVLLISLAAILWLTYHTRPSYCQSAVLFFSVGSLTTYLDLITVPTLTLGLPLLAWLALARRREWGRGIWQAFQMMFWWLAGYVLTWLAKWAIATLLTDVNVFTDAYNEGLVWGRDGGSYIIGAVTSCISLAHYIYILVPAAMLALMALVHPRKDGWRMAVQYLFVMLLPFVYYILMARPAWHHSWFNYRALATAAAAVLMALSAMVDWNRYCQ